MIVYTHATGLYGAEASAYDATYTQDPDRFAHRITFRGLDAIFDRFLPAGAPLCAMDLGCGQGPVIARVRDLHRERSPEAADQSRFYGLDISPVAIEQANERHPDIGWIVDSFQEFLQRPDFDKDYRGCFQLVVNKGGLLSVQEEDEYRTLLQGIDAMLSEGGVYLFVQHKQFYQEWSNHRCTSWSRDVFDIAEETFGSPAVLEERSTYVHMHVKPAARPPASDAWRAKPDRIVFAMEDGSEREVALCGDVLTAERLAKLHATPVVDEPYAFPIDAEANDRARERAETLRDRSIEQFEPGRPSVLVPRHRIRHPKPSGFDPLPVVFDAVGAHMNVIPFHDMCPSVRHYCRNVVGWSAAKPDVLLLGLGLEDHRIHMRSDTPMVDLDEYRYRLDWVLEVATQQVAGTVLWISTPVQHAFTIERSSLRFDPALAREFVDAAASVCQEHGVEYHVFVPDDDEPASAEEQLAAFARRAVAAKGGVACGR